MLKYQGRIISILQIDDKYGDGTVAIFCGVETHPHYQRKDTFWRQLLIPCFRKLANINYERFEAETWILNRKGIPLFKRVGFKVVPDTALVMENYIPLIQKHPQAHAFFYRHDYVRTLQYKRRYGYNNLVVQGMDLFEYRWAARGDLLSVYIDWRKKKIMEI